jgi:hypothetical protein
LKADVIIFLSSSDGADAGSSRCAPGGSERQGCLRRAESVPITLRIEKAVQVTDLFKDSNKFSTRFTALSSGFPTDFEFVVRLSESLFKRGLSKSVKEIAAHADLSLRNHFFREFTCR